MNDLSIRMEINNSCFMGNSLANRVGTYIYAVYELNTKQYLS